MTQHQRAIDEDNEENKQINTNKLILDEDTIQLLASLSTCGLGILSTWTNNKLIKYSFSSLLAYKVYKLFKSNDEIKRFIDKML